VFYYYITISRDRDRRARKRLKSAAAPLDRRAIIKLDLDIRYRCGHAFCMQDTETPTTKPQGRGKSLNSILSSDICLLYVVLRMQTCCSGVCRTYTFPSSTSERGRKRRLLPGSPTRLATACRQQASIRSEPAPCHVGMGANVCLPLSNTMQRHLTSFNPATLLGHQASLAAIVTTRGHVRCPHLQAVIHSYFTHSRADSHAQLTHAHSSLTRAHTQFLTTFIRTHTHALTLTLTHM